LSLEFQLGHVLYLVRENETWIEHAHEKFSIAQSVSRQGQFIKIGSQASYMDFGYVGYLVDNFSCSIDSWLKVRFEKMPQDKRDHDHVETQSLVEPPSQVPSNKHATKASKSYLSMLRGLMISSSLVCLAVVIIWEWLPMQSHYSHKHTVPFESLYNCPEHTLNPDGLNADEPENYLPFAAHIMQNMTSYIENFHHEEYDAWGYSYDHIKSNYIEWKVQAFADVKSGDWIYESAAGLGLNLLMTAEILEQEKGVRDLVLFGNEYVEQSVMIAKKLHDSHKMFPSSTIMGQFCPGDSRDLSYIPDNIFDVVFSGYITPLQDPLEYGEDWSKQTRLDCDADPNAVERAHAIQADWYRVWVGEMIRIAKNGAPVIVEQVSRPLCDEEDDWGGVDRSFWMTLEGVDPKFTYFVDDTIFHSRRYHVFMRKKE